MGKPLKRSTLYGCLTIAGVMLSLVVLPPFLEKREHLEPLFPASDKLETVDLSSSFSSPVFPQYYVDLFRNIAKTAIDRDSVSLRELFGNRKTLIVNFWATWCPPCIEELPTLDHLSRQLQKSQNTDLPQLVTISVDQEVQPIHQLFRALNIRPSFAVLHDPEGQFAEQLGTTKFPETYWIDSKGRILHRWIGPQRWLSEAVVEKLALYTSR